MTSEQCYFIEVLSNFVNVKKSGGELKSPCELEFAHNTLNPDVLASYAKKHEVQAILYYQTKDPNYLSRNSAKAAFRR